MMHKKQEIDINRTDIFNYVVGKTSFDPIEHCIDPTQYEVQQEFIYDHQESKMMGQDEDFIYFNKELDKLRKLVQGEDTAHKIGRAEIIRICKELEEIAPKSVKLPVSDGSSDVWDFKGGMTDEIQQNFKDVFGLPSRKWFRERGDMKE